MAVTLNLSQYFLKDIARACTHLKELPAGSEYEFKRWEHLNTVITLYTSGKLVIQGLDEERVRDLILSKLPMRNELVLGIDEVGRGENFGDLVVCGVLGHSKDFLELRDSKKTKDIAGKKSLVEKNAVKTFLVSFSASEIDFMRSQGISLNQLIARAIDSIIEQAQAVKKEFVVKVDGSKLPIHSAHEPIQFIPKGDDLEPVIGAASVLAKFTRDSSGNKEKRLTWKNAQK